jgi:hypothetical protein
MRYAIYPFTLVLIESLLVSINKKHLCCEVGNDKTEEFNGFCSLHERHSKYVLNIDRLSHGCPNDSSN